jgi:integral membrane protein
MISPHEIARSAPDPAGTPTITPLTLFRRVAVAEAVTWAGLLTGMVLKYVTHSTELGVQVFGMLHGVVFIAYCLTTVVVAVDQRWPLGRLVAGLACAVPPFATLPFDRWAERRGALGSDWRLASGQPAGPADRCVAWLVRHPARGLAAGAVGVAVLTGVALVAGPPA